MIQVQNFPSLNSVLLDGNNTIITVTSSNGVGYYFRAKIYINDVLFDEQGWSRKDNFTAVKDLVYLYNAYFTPQFSGAFVNGLVENSNLKRKVSIVIEDRKILDDSVAATVTLPNFYILYNIKSAKFDATTKASILGLSDPVMRLPKNGKIVLPFYANASNETVSVIVKDDLNNVINSQSLASVSGKKVYQYTLDLTSVTVASSSLYLTAEIKVGTTVAEKTYTIIQMPSYEVKEIVFQNNFGFYIPVYFDGDFEDVMGYKVNSYEQSDNSMAVFAVDEDETYTINTGALTIQEKNIVQEVATSIDCFFMNNGSYLNVIPSIKKAINLKSRLNNYGQDLQFTIKSGLSFANQGNFESTAVLIANNDSFPSLSGTGGVVGNVLANDTYNGQQASVANVDISLVSSNDSGITLNTSNGEISVTSSVASGNYTLVYKISQKGMPGNNATGTVTIAVSSATIIVANNDSFSIAIGGGTAGNILANDTYNGGAATASNVTIVQISTSNPNVTLNGNNGQINVGATVPAGTYTIEYKIYEIGDNSNPKTATATVVVNAATPTIQFSAATSYSVSPYNGNVGGGTASGTITVTGGTFRIRGFASIFTNNSTNVWVNATVNGVSLYAERNNASGITKSGTGVDLAPGTYSYSINISGSGLGGSGNAGLDITQL
jgi:hypothetical protein